MDITITLGDGSTEVINTEDVYSPVFSCECYFGLRTGDYAKRVAEQGLTVEIQNQDGTVSYRHISAHCICQVEFSVDCD